MDISLYLINYMQSRFEAGAHVVEIYIADSIKNNTIEIIIKDDGDKIDEENQVLESFLALSKICTQVSGEFKHLYHRKHTSVHLEWSLNANKNYSIKEFHSLLAMTILNSISFRIVFTYLSKKGEYVFDSQKIITEFTKEELMQKEILMTMNELLEEHLNDVRNNL